MIEKMSEIVSKCGAYPQNNPYPNPNPYPYPNPYPNPNPGGGEEREREREDMCEHDLVRRLCDRCNPTGILRLCHPQGTVHKMHSS